MIVMVFVIIFVCLLIEIPVSVSIGIAAVYGCFATRNIVPSTAGNIMVNSLDSFPLLAVPLFILAGGIMGRSGMAQKLVDVAMIFLGKLKGGLAYATIVTSAFFAALSGSGPATTAAVGGIMIPPMEEAGYRKPFAATLAASSGILGPIIPPSILFVMYGISAQCSIGDLFLAGIIPGLIMCLALVIVVQLNMRTWGKTEIKRPDVVDKTGKEKLKVIWDAKWSLLMPIIILGGIYSGAVTPTEAAVIAVVYSLLICIFVERNMKIRQIPGVLADTVVTQGSLSLIVGAATTFGMVLTMNRVPDNIAKAILGMTDNPIIILLLVNLFLLLVGCFMESIAAIIILTPILLPIAQSCGMSVIAFGILMCVNLVIGQITPPVGVSLFVASGVAKVPVSAMAKYLVQFIIALFCVLLVLSYFPQLSDFLPNAFK